MIPAFIQLEDAQGRQVALFQVEDISAVPRVLSLNSTLYVYQRMFRGANLLYTESPMWVLTTEEVNSPTPLPSKLRL